MSQRPEFNQIKSYEEFLKYYWYRDELSKICKQLNIDDTGTKQNLNNRIREYFQGNIIKKRKHQVSKKNLKPISLDCPLLECGFSFNAKFREYFSKQTGVQNFKFTADMAAAWRKVKEIQDNTFTIQDMLDIYEHKSDYARYDHSTCEWNQFLKDYCADDRNRDDKNKLKSASRLWKIVRDSSLPKCYSYDLVLKYKNLV